MENPKSIILLSLFASTLIFSQPKLIPTKLEKSPASYPWITFLSQGETNWKEGYALRVVVTTSEIYSSVYFDKITFGEEGCCAKVVSTRKMNLEEFARIFSLQGELAGFEFVSWMTSSSFRFKMHNRLFELTELNKDKVLIKEIK